jgi:sensor histidine kinase YesM
MNIIFWVSSAWLLVSAFSVVSVEQTIENGVESQIIRRDALLMFTILGVVGLAAILFYTTLYIINSGRKSALRKTVAYSLGACIAVALVYYMITEIRWGVRFPLLPLSLAIGIITFYYAISIAYGLGNSWQRSEASRKNLMLERNQAELALLRNQLQPHFLFNALNNLLSMIQQKQYSGASDSIEKLAQLLRYVIEETKVEKVSLSQEIQFIRNYTSLQMLRFDPGEIDLQISVLGNTERVFVEPGLFLPFVENAFKYGTEPEKNSVVTIVFDASDNADLKFMISNPVMKNEGPDSTGTGIAATRKRLNIVYPGKHALEITEAEEFTVRLKISGT